MRTNILLILAAFLALPATSKAQEEESAVRRMALMPVRAPGVARTKVDTLAVALSAAAGELVAVELLTPESFPGFLPASQQQLAARCSKVACWRSLARALDAQVLLTVAARNGGDTIRVKLSAVDPGVDGVIAEHTEVIHVDAARYAQGARAAVAHLLRALPADVREQAVDEGAAQAAIEAVAAKPAAALAASEEETLEQPVLSGPLAELAREGASAEVAPSAPTQRGTVGLRYRALRPTEAIDVGVGAGAAVTQVTREGPADKAGVVPEDVILAVDGKSVDGPRGLARVLRELKPGRRIRLSIWRDGARRDLTLVVGARPVPRG